MSKLFLDDQRNPTNVQMAWHNGYWEEFPSLYTWTVVRTYEQFVEFIEKNGLPDVISFDHDLSWEHYPKDELDMSKPIDYGKYKEKTGYHCAQWLAGYCYEKDLPLPEFFVHSMNPEGRKNIISYLTRFEEIRESLKQN